MRVCHIAAINRGIQPEAPAHKVRSCRQHASGIPMTTANVTADPWT